MPQESDDYEKIEPCNKSLPLSVQEELYKEERLSEIARIEVEARWKKLQNEEKNRDEKENETVHLNELKQETERKSKLIDSLKREFDHCDQQFLSASVSHISYVESLLATFHQRLAEIEHDATEGWAAMVREFEKDQQELNDKHTSVVKRLKLDSFLAEKHEDAAVNHELCHHEHRVQEIKSNRENEINSEQVKLESKNKDLSKIKAMMETKQMQVIGVRTSDFDSVSRIHHTLNSDINVMTRKLKRLKASLNLWENKIRKVNINDESKVCQLNLARRDTFQKVKTMKRVIQCTQNDERKRLLQLATDANITKKCLKSRMNRAQKILKRLRFIEHLEKAQESVSFYFPSKLDDDLTLQLSDLKIKFDAELSKNASEASWHNRSDCQENKCWEYMMKFWKKHNIVAHEIEIMKREHQCLIEDNRALKVCNQKQPFRFQICKPYSSLYLL